MPDTIDEAMNYLNDSNDYNSARLLVIDKDLRTISAPKNLILGVYNDKDITTLVFKIPRYYDNIDLRDFDIQVNYINAAGEAGFYTVEDKNVDSEEIYFNWLLGRGVFVAKGSVVFSVCMKVLDNEDRIVQEFNTTYASGRVLEGLEVDDNPDPEAYSILASMQSLERRARNSATNAAASEAILSSMVVVPDPPTTNGTYVLQAVVSNGVPTLSWSLV